jgi:hypothetical protein
MVTSSQRLPITTYLGHTDRALDFYESESIYFALGKTSKWDGEDEENFAPPSPEFDATEVEELVCLKKTSQKLLVYPAEAGEIEFDGQYWKIITPEEAKRLQSRWVYITTTLRYNEVQLTEYRQVGIYNKVQPKDGVVDDLLSPSQVKDFGLLIALNNRYRVTRQIDTRDIYSLVIEF